MIHNCWRPFVATEVAFLAASGRVEHTPSRAPLRTIRGLVFAGAALMMAACGSSPEDRWSGRTSDSAGVRVVEYGRGQEGLDADGLEVREDLRIAASPDSGPMQFVRLGRVASDGRGRFYLLDLGERRLLRLAPNGKFDRIVARSGEGPGELGSGRLQLLMVPGDSVVVVDAANHRLHVYGPDAEFVRDVPIQSETGPAVAWDVTGAGVILKQTKTVITDSASATRAKNAVFVVTPDGADGREVLALALGNVVDMRGGIVGGKTVVFGPEDYWKVIGNDRVVIASNGDYRFHVYDLTGHLETIFSMDVQREPITDQDRSDYLSVMRATLENQLSRSPQPNAQNLIEGMIQKTSFPDSYPAFASFTNGPSGTILVQRFQTLEQMRASGRPIDLQAIQAGSNTWDTFRLDGSYVGRVELPSGFRPTAAGDGFLLGIAQDSAGVPMVVRLRVAMPGLD